MIAGTGAQPSSATQGDSYLASSVPISAWSGGGILNYSGTQYVDNGIDSVGYSHSTALDLNGNIFFISGYCSVRRIDGSTFLLSTLWNPDPAAGCANKINSYFLGGLAVDSSSSVLYISRRVDCENCGGYIIALNFGSTTDPPQDLALYEDYLYYTTWGYHFWTYTWLSRVWRYPLTSTGTEQCLINCVGVNKPYAFTGQSGFSGDNGLAMLGENAFCDDP